MNRRARADRNSHRPCLFCGASPKRTREHIFPSWLTKCIEPELVAGNEQFFYGSFVRGVDEYLKAMQLPRELPPGHVPKRVSFKQYYGKAPCKACNSGWMSVIENRLHWLKLVLQTPGDVPFIVDTDRARDLALWATLKAVVFLHSPHAADSDGEHSMPIPVGWTDALMQQRVPDDAVVDLLPSYHAAKPLGIVYCGLWRSFFVTLKVRCMYLRVIFTHPDDPHTFESMVPSLGLAPWKHGLPARIRDRPYAAPRSAFEEMQHASSIVPVIKT